MTGGIWQGGFGFGRLIVTLLCLPGSFWVSGKDDHQSCCLCCQPPEHYENWLKGLRDKRTFSWIKKGQPLDQKSVHTLVWNYKAGIPKDWKEVFGCKLLAMLFFGGWRTSRAFSSSTFLTSLFAFISWTASITVSSSLLGTEEGYLYWWYTFSPSLFWHQRLEPGNRPAAFGSPAGMVTLTRTVSAA